MLTFFFAEAHAKPVQRGSASKRPRGLEVSIRHRRNRAATIKASDFLLPPRRVRSGTITQRALRLSQIETPSVPLVEDEKKNAKATGRTRSGTIMQRKISLH